VSGARRVIAATTLRLWRVCFVPSSAPERNGSVWPKTEWRLSGEEREILPFVPLAAGPSSTATQTVGETRPSLQHRRKAPKSVIFGPAVPRMSHVRPGNLRQNPRSCHPFPSQSTKPGYQLTFDRIGKMNAGSMRSRAMEQLGPTDLGENCTGQLV
jgi:hypothetical protein